MVCSNRCSLRLQERNAVRWFSEKCEILTPVVFITQGLSNSGTSFILFYIKWLASGAMMNHSLMIRSGHLVSCFNLKDRTAYHIHNCCFFDKVSSLPIYLLSILVSAHLTFRKYLCCLLLTPGRLQQPLCCIYLLLWICDVCSNKCIHLK